MHNLRNLLGLSSAVAGNGAVTVVIAGPPVAKGRKATDEQIAQNYECSVFTALAAQWRNG